MERTIIMVTPRRRLFLCALAFALVAVAACSKDEPGGVGPSTTEVRFDPPAGDLDVTVFTPVTFRVSDTSGKPVVAAFHVDDAFVENTATFVFESRKLGASRVTAVVPRTGGDVTARWEIRVSDEGAKGTPAVVVISVEEGGDPASVSVEWESPPPSMYTIPIKEYVVGYSLDSITEENFGSVASVTVPQDSLQIVQRRLLTGLQERALYHVRVRVRDVLGRESSLSPSRESQATGHFDLQGSISSVERDPPLRPLANVLVDFDGHKDFTSADGLYDLLGLPDRSGAPVSIRDDSGSYYAIQTDSLPPIDQVLDFVLFPREFITYAGSQSDITVSVLDFLRKMTNNYNAEDNRIFGWDHYPVTVYAHEYVNDYGVDYKQAILHAAEAWNMQAGEELFHVVDRQATDPVDGLWGVYYSTDLPPGSVLHGETKMIRPAQARLYEAAPELEQVRFQSLYTNQEFVNRLAAHEFGHVLCMGHSDGRDHLMNSGIPASTGGVPQKDEAYVARLIAHLPQGFDATWFVDSE